MQHPFTNQLIHETSPYLLQHAHNPVNWLPWGEEALQKARAENKIILVSIGYAACHWCHVMERESFEDESTAGIMNDHFINIKIDREERPDIDHIYMDAVQAMTGSGGWPLNVFLTPEAKPFYGGTYFPPVKAFNRNSWKEVLYGVSEAWKNRKEEIEAQAEQLTGHLQQSNDFGQTKAGIAGLANEELFTAAQCHTMFEGIMKAADKEWGGFGNAPKFPQTFSIQYLLQYHRFTGNETALEQALLSLKKMMEGGIYDHAGGGFSRYSTDREWLAPHFEKMLYDNALLLMILSDAYAHTKNKAYEKTIRDSIAFLQREMMDTAGGFYAALDADSEGEEGKFYVWQKQEIDEILEENAAVFCDFFDVSEKGNWEGKNILRILKKSVDFSKEKELDPTEFESQMDQCLAKLLAQRNKRIRPATDDKILLGWNALMITALCKAGAVLNDSSYKKLAVETFDFVWKNLRGKNGELYHTYKKNIAKYPAFLDDYAYLVQACINLQEISSDQQYLLLARDLATAVLDNFSDTDSPYLFYTGKNQTDVIVRKKEVYDGATPSANSIMAENLWYLGIVFDNPEWKQRSQQMMAALAAAVVRHPNSFGVWASGILKQVTGWNEVAVTGQNFENFRDEILAAFIPGKILQSSPGGNADFPLLASKTPGRETQIYLCKNYACLSPFTSTEALLNVILKKDQNLTGTAQ